MIVGIIWVINRVKNGVFLSEKGCLVPKLQAIPETNWYCPDCIKKGKTAINIGMLGNCVGIKV